MATTESLSVKTGAYLDAESSYAQAQYMDKMPGVGIENTNEYMYSMVSYGHISYGFDVSAIPEGSVIDSVTCKAKAKRASSGTTGILQLYSGTTAKGSATTFTDGSMATYTLNAGTWSWDEIQKIRLRITASSSKQYKYIYFYGADLTVTYTYQNEKFMLKLGGANDDVLKLPEGYTRLECIESTGEQCINTEFVATSNNLRIEVEAAYTSEASGQSLFGTQNSSGTPYGLIPYTSAAGTASLYAGSSSKILSVDVAAGVTDKWRIAAKNGTATWEHNGGTSTAAYSDTPNQAYPYFLFANNSGGSPAQFCSAKLYSFKIYDNDILVRDCYPCLNPNGVPGLYDIVNGMFYGSATSTPFVAWPEYNDGWHDIARVFKKVSGIWVEQTELANVVDQTKRLVNGGEYVRPVVIISFTIGKTSLQAEEGMTWAEWCGSDYDTTTNNYAVASNGYVNLGGGAMWLITAEGSHVKGSDTVIAGHTYSITPTGP